MASSQPPITNSSGRPAYFKPPALPRYNRLEDISNSAAPARKTEPAWVTRRKAARAAAKASGMSEPRVRPARHQGQLNFGNELRNMLHAYGDTTPHPSFTQEPNQETVRVLDEMVTDFIIESCHAAAQTASTAGRQKVKAEDFHFALRKDPAKLGRVQELFKLERELKEARKAFNENDDRIAGLKEMEKKNLDKVKQEGGEPSAKGEKKKKGKGKGRPKQANKVTKRRG